jgi:hypothetical protein
LALLAAEIGVEARRVDLNGLHVQVDAQCVLVFRNYPEDDDTLVGFEGSAWHAHEALQLVTDSGDYVSFDELDILIALESGDLVIESLYVEGELRDRWLSHKDQAPDLRNMIPGEELRISRVSCRTVRDESPKR